MVAIIPAFWSVDRTARHDQDAMEDSHGSGKICLVRLEVAPKGGIANHTVVAPQVDPLVFGEFHDVAEYVVDLAGTR